MAKKCVAEKRTFELRPEKSGNPSHGDEGIGGSSVQVQRRTGEGPRRQCACRFLGAVGTPVSVEEMRSKWREMCSEKFMEDLLGCRRTLALC